VSERSPINRKGEKNGPYGGIWGIADNGLPHGRGARGSKKGRRNHIRGGKGRFTSCELRNAASGVKVISSKRAGHGFREDRKK